MGWFNVVSVDSESSNSLNGCQWVGLRSEGVGGHSRSSCQSSSRQKTSLGVLLPHRTITSSTETPSPQGPLYFRVKVGSVCRFSYYSLSYFYIYVPLISLPEIRIETGLSHILIHVYNWESPEFLFETQNQRRRHPTLVNCHGKRITFLIYVGVHILYVFARTMSCTIHGLLVVDDDNKHK